MENVLSGLWNGYFIADGSLSYPSQEAMNDVFNSGVSPHDFFTGANGWNGFPTVDYNTLCQGQLVEIINYTPNPLSVTLDSVSPNVGRQGQSLTVKITDASFQSGAACAFLLAGTSTLCLPGTGGHDEEPWSGNVWARTGCADFTSCTPAGGSCTAETAFQCCSDPANENHPRCVKTGTQTACQGTDTDCKCNTGPACLTGDCGDGEAICAPGHGGDAPATLAEFTLGTGKSSKKDFYDISQVNGGTIGIEMVPTPPGITPTRISLGPCVGADKVCPSPTLCDSEGKCTIDAYDCAAMGAPSTTAGFVPTLQSQRRGGSVNRWLAASVRTRPV